MNFFKSILSDESDPPKPENPHESDPNSSLQPSKEDLRSNDDAEGGGGDIWSFGGLIKTLATRSESVIETYRRDLQEFGSGLKKETEVFKEVASRAVKDLPASLEAGTSAAHGVLDGVLKSTAEIISKEAQIFGSDGEPETPETIRRLSSGRYSWFEAQLSAVQSDLNTFCEDPEDVEEFKKWRSGFRLEEKKGEIDVLIGENGTLEGVYRKVVPGAVDHETFWFRYFYRVDKLKQQERVRANLVKRAMSADDEDELSWDVDDEDENDGNGNEKMGGTKVQGGDESGDRGVGNLNSVEKKESSVGGGSGDEKKGGDINADVGDKNNVIESSTKSEAVPEVQIDEKVKVEESIKSKNNEGGAVEDKSVKLKNDENVSVEVKSVELKKNEILEVDDKSAKLKNGENVGAEQKGVAGEKKEVPIVSNNPSKSEEEDLGWDEIEDIGSGDEKKISTTTHGGSPNRAELRKLLSAAEDDEDLSWDIEDDDEPVKK